MARLKLSPPWYIFVSELEELFKYDPEVHVIYDEDEQRVDLHVDSQPKADALTAILPAEKTWGEVTLKIVVVPANDAVQTGEHGNLYANAFYGNGAFSFTRVVKGIFACNMVYVVFRNRVVQYYTDNLGDIYGNRSTLYQEIAKDVLVPREGVFFCTDLEIPVKENAFGAVNWP